MKQVRARVIVEGIVQGVFFRANTADVARSHGVFGFVMNRPDGSVEAILEGNAENVNKVIEWCRVGPPSARVDRVDVNWEDFKNEFTDFSVVRRHDY